MTVELPDLDKRDEEEVVAAVIDGLPAEISDRNRSNPEVKLIEACGAFYGSLLAQLNKIPEKIQISIINLLGIERQDATKATTTIEFTSTALGATVPAATVVKSGTGVDAIQFVTDVEVVLGASVTVGVASTAVDVGANGNVAVGSLTELNEPIAGIDDVTNPDAASGGQDQESIASMKARVPLETRSQTRAINDEDFQVHAANVNGVERAIAFGSNGNVTVHVVDPTLNETPSLALTSAVKLDLEARTLPSVVVTPYQPGIRIIRLTEVEIQLEDDGNAADVAELITETMLNLVTALDITDTDGVTVLYPAWTFGRSLFVNDLIAAFDVLEGVDRVGQITGEYSDDYGSSWSGATAITEMFAGADGANNPNYGLLHYDEDASDPAIATP